VIFVGDDSVITNAIAQVSAENRKAHLNHKIKSNFNCFLKKQLKNKIKNVNG